MIHANETINLLFQAAATQDKDKIIALAESKRSAFKRMSYEEQFQTLAKLYALLSDPGIIPSEQYCVEAIEKAVKDGFTMFFTGEELKQFSPEADENLPEEELTQIVASLRKRFRGSEADPAEPLKLTLLYDEFRTHGYIIKPEEALLLLDMMDSNNELPKDDRISFVEEVILEHFRGNTPNP